MLRNGYKATELLFGELVVVVDQRAALVFVNGGDLTVVNVNIEGCGAGSGGAIGTTAGSNLTVSNSVFNENMALYGGAIYAVGEANISNCEFNNHEYGTYGGAIYVNTTFPVSISSNKFDGNDADKGEAIHFDEIYRNIDSDIPTTNEILLDLEISGIITAVAGGRYMKI